MACIVGPRERALFTNSLATLLHGAVGHSAVVELKVDVQVSGKVISVDCFTNVTMENAVMTKLNGTKNCFSMFFIPMRSIRAVQLPDYMNIPDVLKEQVSIVTGRKAHEERKKLKLQLEKKRANRKRKQAELEAKQLQGAGV